MAGASSFKVDGPGSPRVRVVSRRKQDVQLRIDFGQRLTQREVGRLSPHVLPQGPGWVGDPGPAGRRLARVVPGVGVRHARRRPTAPSRSCSRRASTSRSRPGKIAAPTTEEDGRTIFRTGKLAKPLEFFAYLVADRPGAYRDDTVATDVLGAPVQVNVRAWQDDQPWAKRISGLLDAGLPALGTRIGLDWPEYSQPLTVQEAVSRTTGGYAGLFDPSAGKVEIAYYADDFVVLHEAAHAWFNGSLLADRWANEAFASYYATVAAADIDKKIRADELTDELEKSRIPLNAWGPVGSEDVARGGLRLRRSAGPRPGHRRSGPATRACRRSGGTRRAASGRINRPAVAPRRRSRPRRIGAACSTCSRSGRTPRTTTCGETWVARDTDLSLLDARAQTRQRYDDDGGRRPGTGTCPARSATPCGRGASATRPRSCPTPRPPWRDARR